MPSPCSSTGHAIAKAEIKRDSVAVCRSPVSDLMNSFVIRFDRDCRYDAGSTDSYCAAIAKSDATSISRYGRRDFLGDPTLFCFDAVIDSNMAEDVGDFLLAWHSVVRRMPEFAVFLDNMEIEPGDVIDITHPLDGMTAFVCEVVKLRHVLGSARRNVIDNIEILAEEN
jgi:hypothetical protein